MVRWLLMALLMASTSCSLALDWDQARLKCGTDPNNLCKPTYSCLITPNEDRCVSDYTQTVGEACTAPVQCVPQASCAKSFIDRPCSTTDPQCTTCLATCDPATAYTTSSCGGNNYCAPFCSAGLAAEPNGLYATCSVANMVGGCAPSANCTANSNCVLANSTALSACVPMSTGATACLKACSFDWTKSPADNCDTFQNNAFCTPVGVSGSQQLVCVEIGTTPLASGATGCNAVTSPCTPGFACINGTCSQLCNRAATSPCLKGTCQAIPGLSPTPPPGANVATTGVCLL